MLLAVVVVDEWNVMMLLKMEMMMKMIDDVNESS
jgi:hypothetical protein